MLGLRISRLYSGRRRGSMVAFTCRKPETVAGTSPAAGRANKTLAVSLEYQIPSQWCLQGVCKFNLLLQVGRCCGSQGNRVESSNGCGVVSKRGSPHKIERQWHASEIIKGPNAHLGTNNRTCPITTPAMHSPRSPTLFSSISQPLRDRVSSAHLTF
jgi:hypothetical protein